MKKKGKFYEVLRFGITGVICFLIEFGVLVFLKSVLGVDTLLATPVAFLISVLVNYWMCIVWVFDTKKNGGNTARIGFIVTSVIGLVLNELLMLLFREALGEDKIICTLFRYDVSMYMLNKCLATLLVMIWNYLTKKRILTSDWMRKMSKHVSQD